MGLIQYGGEFADDFDANDASSFPGTDFERRCRGRRDIFRSAFAPGAGAPRVQMPPRHEPAYDPDGEMEIADDAFNDAPRYTHER